MPVKCGMPSENCSSQERAAGSSKVGSLTNHFAKRVAAFSDLTNGAPRA